MIGDDEEVMRRINCPIRPTVNIDYFYVRPYGTTFKGYYSRKELLTLDKLLVTLREADLYCGG